MFGSILKPPKSWNVECYPNKKQAEACGRACLNLRCAKVLLSAKFTLQSLREDEVDAWRIPNSQAKWAHISWTPLSKDWRSESLDHKQDCCCLGNPSGYKVTACEHFRTREVIFQHSKKHVLKTFNVPGRSWRWFFEGETVNGIWPLYDFWSICKLGSYKSLYSTNNNFSVFSIKLNPFFVYQFLKLRKAKMNKAVPLSFIFGLFRRKNN